jgi:2,4-dienoyl-CoA reductase-like NADH-dependent reductase (Old Yellow Enzyme family)
MSTMLVHRATQQLERAGRRTAGDGAPTSDQDDALADTDAGIPKCNCFIRQDVLLYRSSCHATKGLNMHGSATTTEMAEPVLQPVAIRSLHLGNRAVVAPMSRVSASEVGVPTGRMRDYYASFAHGGFAMVITEGLYTDAHFAQAYTRQPGLVTERQRDGWRAVTDAVHAAGAPMIAQLMHAGALSQCLKHTVAPSQVPPRGQKMSDYGGSGPFPTPQAMSVEQIAAAIGGFVSAARTAAAAGFDGVEIHAANGYLLDQFITEYTNGRTDAFGGSPARRIKLTADVVRAVRTAVAPSFVVGVRLSQTKVNDLAYRWSGSPEATTYFTGVADAGADYIHIASEGRRWHDTAFLPDGCSVTSLARRVTGLPVIANGGMHRPDLAREVIADGHADLVALGTGALANRDWPRRVRDGREFDAFDKSVLHPSASLENADAVEASRRGRRQR